MDDAASVDGSQSFGNLEGEFQGFLDGYAEVGELGAKFWERLLLYQLFATLGALLDAHRRALVEQTQTYKRTLQKCMDELAQ